MSQSFDTQVTLQEIRQKVLAGTATQDDMRRAIDIMREGRVAAAATSRKAKEAKPVKAPVNVDDLLSDLDKMGG